MFRSCVWPASPSDPDSYAAAALLDAPLVFPVVSAITTTSIPFHPIAAAPPPPLQNPLHPCFYGHHNLLSLTDFETLIPDHHHHHHHHHHETFGVGGSGDFLATGAVTDSDHLDIRSAAPFIVAPPPEFAGTHGARTLPRAHRHAQPSHSILQGSHAEHPVGLVEGSPELNDAEVAATLLHSSTPPLVTSSSSSTGTASQNRPPILDSKAVAGEGGDEKDSAKDDSGPFPVYLDRIGTAV